MSGSLVTDTLVYLGAAVVCVPLASRLKLGSVLGYLGAGCLIGPYCLGLVSDPESTLHFSEIGVVLMLFIIGLELDPKHLFKMKRAVFLGGGMQLGACAAFLFAAGLAAGIPWQGAIIAGLALSLSSTAVSMQTMGERNLLGTNLGRTSFAILLFQDIAAIPLVAIVPLLAAEGAKSGGEGSTLMGVLKVVGAIVAVVVLGRFVTQPILRAIARLHLREVFTAFTLLLVLGIAQLMTMAGVSMALGAFLAGVLLAGSEYRHALETDIQPFKGLLMGLFFIAVGMSINFGLFADSPLMVIGVVVGFQALKGIALASVARPLGVSRIQRWLFAALLVQGGEFAFVVFGVARTAKLLPGTWEGVLTLAVALSMALTPLFLFLYDHFVVGRAAGNDREADTIEDEHAPVIIAGFGRFGQIVGRLLFASGLTATVLDHDPDQIELLKRFGFRIYYGDATRLDLLEAAGANSAKLLVVAIDDETMSVQLVDAVRHAFPKLKIVARARNVGHYRELRARGVEIVERETFESALLLGRRVLEHLGVGKYEARERADRFRRHNIEMLEQVIDQWDDLEQRTKIA
ncbi:MAG: glutathione-regulated potassium-efflux system protein KefC, partial [Polyangiaceae bacterium]|nr:glutathione-regulated potassium-efflux system protein KefC [Polyangiaceae bacterium]